MKVVHVTRQFYPGKGGIESAVFNLGVGLQARGHSVDIVTLNRLWENPTRLADHETVKGLNIIRLPFWGSRRYALAPSIVNHVKDCDLLHLHSSDFFLDFLSFTRFFHHLPLVLHTHGLYFHSMFMSGVKGVYFKTITKLSLKGVRAILCVSEQDMHLIQNIAPPEKCHLIPNGVDPSFFELTGSARDPDLILSVGRLSANKRYHLLLEVFRRVLAKRPNARLVIIGKDQGELASLQSHAQRLGVSGKVKFMGEVPQHVLLEMIATASIWATASNYESFGIALLESMAAGCIPVAQKLTAFEDYLIDGKNGYLTDYQYLDHSAEVLLHAMNLGQGERERVSAEARVTANAYTWNRIVDQVERIYRSILSR